MYRLAAAAAAVLSLAFPTAPAADPRVEGQIQTDQGHVEILGRPVRVGERVDLPEGWIRVEEKGTEDENVGSFSVVSAESFGAAGAVPPADVASAGSPADAREVPRRCVAERNAYLAQLWKESGIEEPSNPGALIEGLEAGAAGPGTGYYWFALQTDPFRPLAWSSDLRDRADALVRCMRAK